MHAWPVRIDVYRVLSFVIRKRRLFFGLIPSQCPFKVNFVFFFSLLKRTVLFLTWGTSEDVAYRNEANMHYN